MRRMVIAAVAVTALIVSVVLTVSFGDDSPSPKQSGQNTLQQQLAGEGYHQVKETTNKSGHENRQVTDQRWERTAAPEVIIVTADSANNGGAFQINNISFNGSDGNGNLDCQPNPGDTTSLPMLIRDADAVRTAVRNGTAKPVGLFPYGGEHVGCLQ